MDTTTIEDMIANGSIDLPAMLDAYTLERHLVTRQQPAFPQVIEAHHQQQQTIVKTARELLLEIPLAAEEGNVTKALECLVFDYIRREYGLRYDLLSPEMFELEREVSATIKDKKYKMDIPLFTKIKWGEREWKEQRTFEESYQRITVDFVARAPPMTSVVKEEAREALAYFQDCYSKCLREPILGDLLLKWMKVSYQPQCDLSIYWIPSPTELKITTKIVEKDPLLIANLHRQQFLITRWDVLGEEPYEHYLAKYGRMK